MFGIRRLVRVVVHSMWESIGLRVRIMSTLENSSCRIGRIMIECGLDLSALLVEFRKLGDLSQSNGRIDVLSIGLKQLGDSLPNVGSNIDMFRGVLLALRLSIRRQRESYCVNNLELCLIIQRF